MKAAKKDILLMFDKNYTKPIMVLGDAEKLQQVITNLVVNTIKYGKTKGTTEISIIENNNNKVRVSIKDDGIGIETHNLDRVFERFFRVNQSGSREEGGSGLGLAIVKHIVEAHDEKIYLTSSYKIGTEISFTIEKARLVVSK